MTMGDIKDFQPLVENYEVSPSLTPKTPDEIEELQLKTIDRLIGKRGAWQFTFCILLSIFQCICTLHMFSFVIQTFNKPFWCARPPQLANIDPAIWTNFSQPEDSCRIIDVDYKDVGYSNGTWHNIESIRNVTRMRSCTEFEYARGVNGDGNAKTIIEEFGLICDRRELLSIVEMCFLAGAAVGSVASGWISDRFGRRHTLMAFATLQTAFGVLTTFSTSLTMYMVVRFVMGFASMTVTVVSFVLIVELVSGKWRTIVGILSILPVALAYIMAAAVAYYVPDWRRLQFVLSAPWALLLTIWYWLPESPRWLLARGRLTELGRLIEHAAKFNKMPLHANYKRSLELAYIESKKAESSPNELNVSGNPVMVVLSRQYLRTTCLTLVTWFSLIIIYFGLTLHLSNLGGNIYINTVIAGTLEAISICVSLPVVLRFGLRRCLITYMLLSGVCCLATNVVPAGNDGLFGVIGLAIFAKCLIGANNAILPTYTAMQYPTVVRNFGVGVGNLAAGFALMAVPYLWLLEHFDPLLPMSIMGVCGLIGTVAVLLMNDVQEI